MYTSLQAGFAPMLSSLRVMDGDSNAFNNYLTMFLCLGIIFSYLPQLYRIVAQRSSEGFSPYFLLLGSTSAASGMMNMFALQWRYITHCDEVPFGRCVEMLGGIFQVGLTWLLFSSILVLYMIYFPSHLKFADVEIESSDHRRHERVHTNLKTDDWRLSVTVSWVVFIHLIFVTFVTFLLVGLTPGSYSRQIELWATFLGLTSALLAMVQYAPQLVRTYNRKLVGALSIPMMIMQTPGALLMVLSIALREGTNWTSWITFATASFMQGILLFICIAWKIRQRRLGIDDFGVPIDRLRSSSPVGSVDDQIEEAIEEDIRSPPPASSDVTVDGHAIDHFTGAAGEETPLLAPSSLSSSKHSAGKGKRRRSWRSAFMSWFKAPNHRDDRS